MSKIMLMGIQPTKSLHLGHYLSILKCINNVSIIKNLNLQIFTMIADMHALVQKNFNNTYIEKIIEHNSHNLMAELLASFNFNFRKITVFQQSKIFGHNELYWILNSNISINEINKMIQYKNSNYKNLGLLNYPVLQASDILLYDSDFVAIGHDQRQHLELSRKIAKNINRRVGKNIFKIPVPLINKNVNLVRGLQSNSKMSKSSPNLNDTIFLLDTFEEIEYKINKAKTDCTDIIEYDEIKKPELSNMLKIYSTLANKTINEITLLFQNKNYKFFKEKLTDMLIFRLKFFRKNVCLIKNESYKLKNFMHANNIIAKKIAKKNLLKIYKYTNLI